MGNKKPDWLPDLENEVVLAVKLGNQHLGEALLGLEAMVDRDDLVEARKVSGQIRYDMAIHLNYGFAGELDSSQLQAMLRDESYQKIDPVLCDKLRKATNGR